MSLFELISDGVFWLFPMEKIGPGPRVGRTVHKYPESTFSQSFAISILLFYITPYLCYTVIVAGVRAQPQTASQAGTTLQFSWSSENLSQKEKGSITLTQLLQQPSEQTISAFYAPTVNGKIEKWPWAQGRISLLLCGCHGHWALLPLVLTLIQEMFRTFLAVPSLNTDKAGSTQNTVWAIPPAKNQMFSPAHVALNPILAEQTWIYIPVSKRAVVRKKWTLLPN